MSLQIGDCLVRITGNEHHHILGLVRESFSQSLDAMGNGFQLLVIHHGSAFTVIRQQPSCPNVNADGEAALVDDAVHLSNTVSHFLVGSEKGSEDHASILLPCLVCRHDSALDEESAIVFVVDEVGIESSIPHDGILVETFLDVDGVIDDGKARASIVADSHGCDGYEKNTNAKELQPLYSRRLKQVSVTLRMPGGVKTRNDSHH